MSSRPNVLFILADDLGWGDVSYHGSLIRTPNIDRLAAYGVELDYHYVCPVCTPTRVSLLTGRHPGRFGKHATVPSNPPVLPDGYFTLGSLFREAGYATGLFGKWHLGSDPQYYPGNYGFDACYGSFAGGVDPYRHVYKKGPFSDTWHRNGTKEDAQGHVTDLVTDEALDWIQQQSGPWFCYVPFTAVHTPVRAPEEWIDAYWFEEYDRDPDRDRSLKTYAAYTSHMDASVGRFVELLKELDQIDNTIVIFTSDNGGVTLNPSGDTAHYPGYQEDMPRTGNNFPLKGHKAQLYEGGIRTPAAISWRSKLQPRKVSTPVQMVDWLPTFATMLGVDCPDAEVLDGRDIWPLITGEAEGAGDRIFYWNLRHERFAVRRGDWKLIRTKRPDYTQYELFNIAEDPYEAYEISLKHPDLVKELDALIEAEHAKDNASRREDAPLDY